MKPNILISHDPSHSGSAKDAILNLFKDVKQDIKQIKKEVDGLFSANVKDARKAVKELAKICEKDSARFEKTFHYIPIDKWCKSTVADMQKAIKGFAKDIRKTEKWKMELCKRKKKGHDIELILKLTEAVDRPKVDLESPDKIIKVEIIGNKAGIALLKKGEILSVPRTKGG